VREVPCPQCGEYLGVPVEFERGPIRCGACSRVIQAHEHSPQQNRAPQSAADTRQDDDDDSSRNTRLDDDGQPKQRKPRTRREDDDSPPRKPRSNRLLLVLFGWVTVFGLVCCGCGGVAIWQVSKPEWTPYTTKEFTVTFPKAPTYSDTVYTTGDGKTERLQQYLSQLPFQQQSYIVLHTPLPKGTGKVWREAQMNALVDELKKSGQFGFQETSRTNKVISGQPGIEVEGTGQHPQAGQSTMIVRLVVIERRMFVLVALGKDRKKMAENMQRFFDSFIVTPAAVKE
jgi:hypothetical protein